MRYVFHSFLPFLYTSFWSCPCLLMLTSHNIALPEFSIQSLFIYFFGLDVEVMQSWKDFAGGLALDLCISVQKISSCKSFTLERTPHWGPLYSWDIMETLRHGDELQSRWCVSSGRGIFFPSFFEECFCKALSAACGSVHSKNITENNTHAKNPPACVSSENQLSQLLEKKSTQWHFYGAFYLICFCRLLWWFSLISALNVIRQYTLRI